MVRRVTVPVGSNLLLLPINSDQASFTLSATVNNQNATRTWSWRIVGAEQVTTDVSSGITLTNGSAPYYGCRAWAHYDGINDELKANGNIASVKRNFIGNYTFTFTTPMPDANYSTNVSVSNEFSSTAGHMVPFIMNQTTTTLMYRFMMKIIAIMQKTNHMLTYQYLLNDLLSL